MTRRSRRRVSHSCSHCRRAWLWLPGILVLLLAARGRFYMIIHSSQRENRGGDNREPPALMSLIDTAKMSIKENVNHDVIHIRASTPDHESASDNEAGAALTHDSVADGMDEEVPSSASSGSSSDVPVQSNEPNLHTSVSDSEDVAHIETMESPLAFTCGMDDRKLNKGKCCLAGRLKCLLSALFRRERAIPSDPRHRAGYLKEKWPNFLTLFNNPELLLPASYPKQHRVDSARLLTERKDLTKRLKCPANLNGQCTTSTVMMTKPKTVKQEKWQGGGCIDFCLCHIPPHLVATFARLASILKPAAAVEAAVAATLKLLPKKFLGIHWRPPGRQTPHWARGALLEKEPSIYTFTMAIRPLCSAGRNAGNSEACKVVFLAVRAHDGGFGERVHRKNGVRAVKEAVEVDALSSASVVSRDDDDAMSSEQNSLVDLLVLKHASELVLSELADFSDLAWLLGGGKAQVTVPTLTSMRGLPGGGESCWSQNGPPASRWGAASRGASTEERGF